MGSVFSQPIVTTLATSSQCQEPSGISLVITEDVDPIVYVSCRLGNVIGITNGTVVTVATHSQCSNPHSITTDESTGTVYATCWDEDQVISIDKNIITPLIDPSWCLHPTAIFADSITNVLYVACQGGDIININGGVKKTVATSSQCPNPIDITVDLATNIIYAACKTGESAIISIEYQNGTYITTKIATNSECPLVNKLFFDSITSTLYATCQKGNVINIRNGTVVTVVENHDCVFSSGITGAFGMIYIACLNRGIFGIGNGNAIILTTFSQCGGPYRMSIDKDTETMYAICEKANAVIKIQNIRRLF